MKSSGSGCWCCAERNWRHDGQFFILRIADAWISLQTASTVEIDLV
jgi:Ni,Fe-hydrogenase I small subunit